MTKRKKIAIISAITIALITLIIIAGIINYIISIYNLSIIHI